MGHFREHGKRVQGGGAVAAKGHPLPLTPVQAHKLRTAPEAPAGANATATLRAKASGRAGAIAGAKTERQRFADDVEGLHGISIAAKIERKRVLIEQYRATVEGLLAAGAPREKLFTWWVLWLYDVGAIEQFIPRARQAIAHGWLTDISRDLQTFLWDKVLEWATAERKAGRSVEPYFGQVYPAEAPRMIEVVQTKYHKFAGDLLLEAADAADDAPTEQIALSKAVACWQAAQAAYDKAGVNTRIDQAQRRLVKLGTDGPADAAPAEATPNAAPPKPASKRKKTKSKSKKAQPTRHRPAGNAVSGRA